LIEELVGLIGLLVLAWFLRAKVFEGGESE